MWPFDLLSYQSTIPHIKLNNKAQRELFLESFLILKSKKGIIAAMALNENPDWVVCEESGEKLFSQ